MEPLWAADASVESGVSAAQFGVRRKPMQMLRCAVCGLLAAVAACSSPSPTVKAPLGEKHAEEPLGVTLAAVKWPELESAIAAQQGKVIVLDVWAEY
jgi:hypothetical protein